MALASPYLRAFLALLCAFLMSATAAAAPKTPRSRSSKPVASKSAGKSRQVRQAGKSKKRLNARRRGSNRYRGQRVMQPQRAHEIQQALLREGYLEGQPQGTWDLRAQQAMARYQRDNGWQHKVTPDARALIKLGLGPSHENLLNPDTAATSLPPSPAVNGNSGPATDRQ